MFYSGLFYSGLILFFGIHLVPMFSNVRKYIVEKTGENAYRGIFSLVSLGGFFLIIFGYQSSDDFLYDINDLVSAYSGYIMLIAIIFFISSILPDSYIKKFSKHPMSVGIVIWAGVHLLVNPDFNSIILFGAFLIYAIVSALFAEMRKKESKPISPKLQFDFLAIFLGAGITYLAFHYHSYLSGVSLEG